MHHFFLFQIRAYGSTLFMESLDLRLCLKFLDDVDKNLPQCSAKWCLRAGIIGTKGWNLLLRLYSLRDWGYANNFWVVQFHACQNRVFFLLNTDYFEWEWQFLHLLMQGVSSRYDIVHWNPRCGWPTKVDFQVLKKFAAHLGGFDIWVLSIFKM